MNHLNFIVLLFVISGVMSSKANAKCYTFKKGREYKVCVPGDSSYYRKKAKAICKKVKKKDCGQITSYSSLCNSFNKKCFDQNGKAHQKLKGY